MTPIDSTWPSLPKLGSAWLSLALVISLSQCTGACWEFALEPLRLRFVLSGVCSPSEANYCSNPFEVFIKKPRFFFLLLKDSRRWKQLMMLDYLSEIYVVRYVSKIHIPKILSGDRDLCFMAAIMRTFSRLSPLTEKKFLSCCMRIIAYILKECHCDCSLYIQFHLWECDILLLATTTL